MNRLFKTAFTLIELLVVIAIIGILSGLIVVTMNGVTEKANIAKSQVFSNSLRNALMLNLVSEWKFDNVSGTVGQAVSDGTSIIDSWGIFNGTTSGGPILKDGADCIYSKCLNFTGSNYITFTNPALSDIVGNQLTIALWIKFNVVNTDQFIITKNGPFLFYLTGSDSKFRNMIYTGAWTTNTSNALASSNRWYYSAMVYDGVNIKLYINGVVDSSTPKTGSLAGDGCVQLGRYNSGGCSGSPDRYLNAFVDDVRIYKAVIPTSQIKEQYYSGLNSLLAIGGISKEEYQERIIETSLR